MADDYIGRRMDDYLSGRLAPAYRPRRTPAAAQSGLLSFRFDPQRILLLTDDITSPIARGLIHRLVRAGSRVAFCTDTPARRAVTVAYETGGQYRPEKPQAAFNKLTADDDEPSIVLAINNIPPLLACRTIYIGPEPIEQESLTQITFDADVDPQTIIDTALIFCLPEIAIKNYHITK